MTDLVEKKVSRKTARRKAANHAEKLAKRLRQADLSTEEADLAFKYKHGWIRVDGGGGGVSMLARSLDGTRTIAARNGPEGYQLRKVTAHKKALSVYTARAAKRAMPPVKAIKPGTPKSRVARTDVRPKNVARTKIPAPPKIVRDRTKRNRAHAKIMAKQAAQTRRIIATTGLRTARIQSRPGSGPVSSHNPRWGVLSSMSNADLSITPGGRVGDSSSLARPGYKGKRKLSDYEREVAHALMKRKGMTKGRAIQVARGVINHAAATGRWGKGKASANVQAGAVASIAQRQSFSNGRATVIDLGQSGSKWKHGYIPLNPAAVALKMHRKPKGGSRPSSSTAKHKAGLMRQHGGFSLNEHGQTPKGGYMVSFDAKHGGVEHKIAGKATARQIDKHHAAVAGKLGSSNVYHGGWHDASSNHTYLDASKRHSNIGSAAKMAHAQGQLAIYDVKNGKEIKTADALKMAAKAQKAKGKVGGKPVGKVAASSSPFRAKVKQSPFQKQQAYARARQAAKTASLSNMEQTVNLAGKTPAHPKMKLQRARMVAKVKARRLRSVKA